MAFKELSSFIRFVTMGALGTRQAIHLLRQAGHTPIELERYCSSNKIWMTKIKRLRLPDLICTHCGQRFEVRGKSSLEIKMSDSPNVADRGWDAGLRDEDRAIFLTIHDVGGVLTPARSLNAFLIGALRASVKASKLGKPKSASEGAERDRTWSSWVPSRDGTVSEITTPSNGVTSIRVAYADGGKYTYRCVFKNPHVTVGDTFFAEERIAASVVASTATVVCPGRNWQPGLDAPDRNDLYASLKVIAAEARQADLGRLRTLTYHEDRRVGLEATKAIAALSDANAVRSLQTTAMLAGEDAPWAMEAVLILTELPRAVSENPLKQIAANAPHGEVRAAAAWGIGVVGCNVKELIPIFSDSDRNVVNHSVIAAARRVVSADDTAVLIHCLHQELPIAAAACEVLSRARAPDVRQLLLAAAGVGTASVWAISCLARLSPELVKACPDWKALHADQKSGLERMWFWRTTSPYAIAGVAADLDLLNRQLFPV